jgi:hypothetical protein
MLEGKRMIFTVSPGRCGTRYLSEMLRTVPGIAVEHEPKPDFADAARLAQFVPEASLRFWTEHKLPHIVRFPESVYFETGHVFVNGFADTLIELGYVADLVTLTRPHREAALSRWRRGSFPVRSELGSRYTIHPNARGVLLPVNDWERWHDYQLVYWFCLEVAARADRYAEMYREMGARVHRTSLAKITRERGFLRLVSDLGLLAPDMRAYRRIAAERYNATSRQAKKRTPDGDLDEMEAEVDGAVVTYVKSKSPDKPSVHIFLVNTGSIREELSAWRERWCGDARFDVKIEGARGFPVCDNRGRAVLKFLAGKRSYMVMVDEDVVPRRNILDLIERDLDIVCFPTPIWRPSKSPQMPALLNVTLLDKRGETISGDMVMGAAEDLHPISSGGTGCLMVARRVFEHSAMFHAFQDLWRFDGTRAIGNDIWFVRRAIEAGFKAWAAMRYPCSHYKELDLLQVHMTYDNLIKSGEVNYALD